MRVHDVRDRFHPTASGPRIRFSIIKVQRKDNRNTEVQFHPKLKRWSILKCGIQTRVCIEGQRIKDIHKSTWYSSEITLLLRSTWDRLIKERTRTRNSSGERIYFQYNHTLLFLDTLYIHIAVFYSYYQESIHFLYEVCKKFLDLLPFSSTVKFHVGKCVSNTTLPSSESLEWILCQELFSWNWRRLVIYFYCCAICFLISLYHLRVWFQRKTRALF